MTDQCFNIYHFYNITPIIITIPIITIAKYFIRYRYHCHRRRGEKESFNQYFNRKKIQYIALLMTAINVIISYKIPFASLLSKARWGHKGKLLFRRKHRALLALSITLLQKTGLERKKKREKEEAVE